MVKHEASGKFKGSGEFTNRAVYQVESYLPDGIKAELHAAFSSFDEAFDWMEQRLKENEKRWVRFIYSGTLTEAQSARLARYNIQNTYPEARSPLLAFFQENLESKHMKDLLPRGEVVKDAE